ncbi:MAG: PAS domain-containing protein [Anaerolineales bacterium]|nr:PAS domain-containing protein [Anaerolineales bacterium]
MAGYYWLYIILSTSGIIIAISLAAHLWRIRHTPGAFSLIWAILSVAIWSFTYIFEIIIPDYAIKNIWLRGEYLGIPFVTVALFCFALLYSGRGRWLTAGRFILLSIIPFITFLMALTNDWHGLLWSSVQPVSPSEPLLVTHGPWFNVNLVYSYSLTLLAMLFLLQIAMQRHSLYRAQAITILIGLFLPLVSNILYVFHLTPPGLDLTPLALILTLILAVVAFTRFRLMDILPIAQVTVFNALLDAVLVVDLKFRIVEMNPSGEQLFSEKADRLIGKDIRSLFPHWGAWVQATKPAYETSREFRLENDPRNRIFNVRLETITEKRAGVTGYMAILSDVTEQVYAQTQMRLQSTALLATRNGILITDKNGTVIWANPAMATLTGYDPDEIVGSTPRLLRSGKMPDSFYREMWDTISDGNVWRGELVNRRKNGSCYDEEMTITPLIQANGSISHYIAVKQDITERKVAENALKKAHAEAMKANQLKTQLLANVSHDLRTPLGAVIGYAEMLEMGIFGKMNSEQDNAVNEILDSANQLLAFVNNMIGQAQFETGRILLTDRAFAPDELIEPIRAWTSFYAKKRGLSLIFDVDADLPNPLYGDPYWLRQVLLNLVINAIKFTEKGGVRVQLFKADTRHWTIRVTDTGIGIPRKNQKAIFEPFTHLEGSTARKQVGSGLGLSIVKLLTKAMKGRIQLDSTPGQGTTFTITLPLAIPKGSRRYAPR